MSPTITFAPHQSSPLARTTSPFKDPRTPPCTPGMTAKLWDYHEKRAMENARRRESTSSVAPRQTQQSARLSNGTVLEIIKSYDPNSSPKVPSSTRARSSQFDASFSSQHNWPSDATPFTTVAICKTCKQPIPSALGICERCKKTIILTSVTGETTPPLTPAARNFASTDLPQLQKTSTFGTSTVTSTSPKRKSRRRPSTQLFDTPFRLSSLRPPPPLQDSPRASSEVPRARKSSLTDPNEPFLRLHISRKPVPSPVTHPAPPTTPPSTSHSHHSASLTRPSSLANITTPPTDTHSSNHHTSATPSELSALYPYISSSTTTSPPSATRTSYQLQNATSVWDDWDSEDEEDKIGLVAYWRGRKWRGSRGSLGAQGSSVSAQKDCGVREEGAYGKTEVRRKRRGFVRVISCGCSED